MNIFRQIWTVIRGLMGSVLGVMLITAAKDLVSTLGKQAVDDLSARAKAKALELEQTYPNGNGAIKREAVLDYLRKYAEVNGYQIAASSLGFILEAAITALKALGQL